MGSLLENKDEEESQALEERSHSSWEPRSVAESQLDISSPFPSNSTFPCAEGSLVFKGLLSHGIV